MKLLFVIAALSHVILAAKVIPLPVGPPLAAPDYMVNNQGNTFGVAPDKGNLNGPVISAANISVNANSTGDANLTSLHLEDTMPGYTPGYFEKRQSSAFWMETIEHGQMPLQAQPYTFFRNVMDYGAEGDGVTDDTAAINMAASSGNRCGETCGSTTISGALAYFPVGTYLISSPIIQYYYTQFVGNANSKPTLKGSANFSGIALIDSDVYIPGANGNEWYINQNQFYRQATSLLNIDFVMPVSDSAGATTAVGIFMENGSGGFVSDLTFTGGNIGFRAGSQQFTARNLQFTSCLTAISMVWDWGFTWKSISVLSCFVALDLTEYGGLGGQGTGSVSVIDSHFNGVPFAITTNAEGFVPNIVLDNLLVENSQSIVLGSGGATILEGSSGAVTIKSWAIGSRYTTIDGLGGPVTGYVSPSPTKSPNLLDSSGKFFERSKPQYGNVAASSFLVATAHGISNDGTGDQSGAINSLLSGAGGTPVFFPAGIYQVQSTINVPTGSVIVGEGWSQIMGTGSFFEDINNPQVMVKFGNAGDVGTIVISDILFTVKGPTAGAILVEWNVQESSQGATAMWDCHFRVGGALGTNLQLADYPKLTGSLNDNCKAVSLLFHVTHSASGYFENIWAWVADHDIDEPPDGNMTTTSQINIYAARGILIESQDPTWWYGTAAEHSSLYQYQLLGANNVYLSHMQTETPYYQANPTAIAPYGAGHFPSDPVFTDCSTDISCVEAYALRVLNSTKVYIYSAGFYSFFQQYDQTCLLTESCQERIIETSFTQGLWLYNLFTKGIVQVISPDGGIPPLLQGDSGQGGYTTEISVWLPLALEGANIGAGSGPSVVYVDPGIWSEPNPTVDCIPPCIIVLPPKQLSSTTTISFPPYTTSITEFCSGSQTVVSTTIDIPPVTTTAIDYWNVNITTAPTTIVATSSIQAFPFIITESCNAITTTFYPPPYPYSTPTATQGNPTVTYSSGAPSPTCTHDCGHECNVFCIGPCLFCIPCLTCFPGGIPPPVGAGGEECETTITTECQSVCVTSPTSSCSSTCSPVIDCEAEPTNGITAIAPAYGANWQWPIYTVDTAFDESIYSRMSQTLNSIFGTPGSGGGGGGGGGGGNPTPTSTIVIEPTGTTVNCVSPSPILGGTSMLDCLNIVVGSGAVDPNTNYCTDTSGACSASGTGYCYADPNSGGKCDSNQSTDPGNGVIPVDSYCVLASSSECGFVVSLKGSNFGGNFPNSVCVTGAEISQFVRTAANQCGNGGTTDALALQQSPDTEGTTWCLADKNNAGVCGA